MTSTDGSNGVTPRNPVPGRTAPERPAPGSTVPEPRLAASVILLRDAPGGLETFVQHRVATMDFAAGMVVFPGGRVDAADKAGREYPDGLLDAHAQDWKLASIGAGAGSAQARADAGMVLAAAQREVFEEAGLRLDAADLRPWANWVTPPDMPKRFDTYFYVARPAPGAEPRHQTTEASSSLWMPVRDILAAEEAGRLKLMPPTLFLLKEVGALGGVEAVWSAEHPIVPVHPAAGAMAAFLKGRTNRR
ncbi:NUDIX domain-containing protein [Arthrobacter sp. CJ23]|uniref:NUDIX hydrolase n=1 Tax=Arthrobacter sp. CJ23 TaxID=2972479 RepID=UPI00215B93EA|nr:NUDIX domain-containing protein [Arthrobacter sp. CJ23]UVJ39252.1 NUDIX domain-containing protein [Arthrobacter sp. CJ23]